VRCIKTFFLGFENKKNIFVKCNEIDKNRNNYFSQTFDELFGRSLRIAAYLGSQRSEGYKNNERKK
jgi:hypothetical protein